MIHSGGDDPSDGKTGQFSFAEITRAAERTLPCVVVVAGPQIGRVFDIPVAPQTIGRAPNSDVVLVADGISRRHATLEREGGGVRVRDLDSTNGTFVNGVAHTACQLQHGDILTIGAATLRFVEANSLERDHYRYIWESSVRDPLTGVYNRGHFDTTLRSEVARACRHGRALALLMVDIDHFKAVNDTHGHPAGDAVLRAIPLAVASVLRATDVLARYGGEEFVILLPETGIDGALSAGERVRAAVEAHPFEAQGQTLHVTVSVGAAALGPQTGTPDELVASADANLYEAKRTGRNRVVAAGR